MAETKTNEFLGTGRRKTAVARVRLASGNGKITVNGRAFDNYFVLETQRAQAAQPLTVTGTVEKFDVRVNVAGGGPSGQADAVRHGIASRARANGSNTQNVNCAGNFQAQLLRAGAGFFV